jgi:hypothetical protein
MTHTIPGTTTLMFRYPGNSKLVCFHGVAGFVPMVPARQILLALDSDSCHNIIKLEQKFPVRNARKANWCTFFTALKAFQVTQDLPSRLRLLVVSLRSAGDG